MEKLFDWPASLWYQELSSAFLEEFMIIMITLVDIFCALIRLSDFDIVFPDIDFMCLQLLCT